MSIDRVARAMVDVEPSADLEARIRARVRAARPARSTAWWPVAGPLTAAAAIALGLVVVQGPASRVQRPGTSVGVQGARSPEVVTSVGVQESRSPGVVRTSPLPKGRAPQLSKGASRLSAEEIAWMERRMPALAQPSVLHMDHLRVDSIQPEPLAIPPLTMTPVATEGGGIERRNDR